MAASQFISSGVEARSLLSCPEMNGFYNEMKKTVWKICITHKTRGSNTVEKYYTGVCIREDGLLLTSYLDEEKISEINARGANGDCVGAQLAHQSSALGYALVQPEHRGRRCTFNYVRFAPKIGNGNVGQVLYGMVYPRNATSPILLVGHLAYAYRKVKDLVEMKNPVSLGEDVGLLQMSGLGATTENQANSECSIVNNYGLTEGCGGPIFDAIGQLLGLISFQHAGFDFAIPVKPLEQTINSIPFSPEFASGHGQSSKRSMQKRKSKA